MMPRSVILQQELKMIGKGCGILLLITGVATVINDGAAAFSAGGFAPMTFASLWLQFDNYGLEHLRASILSQSPSIWYMAVYPLLSLWVWPVFCIVGVLMLVFSRGGR
jgi:hypothetical protein